jgi:hypothetical protein
MGFAINISHARKQKDNRKDNNTYQVIALNGKENNKHIKKVNAFS